MAQMPPIKADDFRALPHELRTQCVQSLQTPLPEEANAAPIRPGFGDVHAMELYYGLGDHARDYVAARRHAWGERIGYSNYDPSFLLAMIYANGLGAPRNPALAMRMACESAAHSNMPEQGLEQFAKLAQGQTPPPLQYDICNPENETPSAAKNVCPALASARAQQQWYDQLKAISANWTPEQKQKLDALKYASRFYLASIQSGDNTLSKLENTELKLIETMETGHLPATAPMPADDADAQYNAIYAKVLDQLRAPSKDLDGVHSVFLDRSQQVDWIAFRDAWMSLMASRFPSLNGDKWRAQLTAERTEILRHFSASLPPVDPGAKDWLATCAQYRYTPLPADIRAAQPPPSRAPCSSAASYYGLGIPVDYAEARRCAIQERFLMANLYSTLWWAVPASSAQGAARFDQDLDEIGIKGSATLAMLYADGKGVPRNTSLAMRFTCEAIDDGTIEASTDSGSDASDESPGRYVNYRTLLHDVATRSSIDMCEYRPDLEWDITDCDYIDHLRGDRQRTATIASFSARFTPDQKSAYLKLVSAFEAYLKAHNYGETTVFGHHTANPQWDRQPQEEEDFIKTMRRLESGHLPSSTAADYARADRALNDLYRQTMATAKDSGADGGEYPPTPKGLLETERLWLACRDAWAAFGQLRYPQVSKESWLTWATLQRIEDLKTFGELG